MALLSAAALWWPLMPLKEGKGGCGVARSLPLAFQCFSLSSSARSLARRSSRSDWMLLSSMSKIIRSGTLGTAEPDAWFEAEA
jgi:hypothetical protein